MFLPTTKAEVEKLGWDHLDVILVTGDSYIDSPFIGIAVIGKVLIKAGFKVGIIAQPDIHSNRDICRLGEPELFWGVSAGSIDSMVANYTSLNKKRKSDDYTPGGLNNRRPDRATIVYSNLIRRFFKRTRPIVLGGIEASLRRIAHYDFWSDRVRRSILFDSKADYLLYGMAEKPAIEFARRLQAGEGIEDIGSLCYLSKQSKAGYIELPPYEIVTDDKHAFIDMFHIFYQNNDPLTAKGLYQKHGDRFLIQNPPASYLKQEELDSVYRIKYERAQHPYYESQGKVKALETIRFSIATHRGCYGECNFCAIAIHEGRTVRWRSSESIREEAEVISAHSEFKGYIHDVGGPTANMYGFECQKKLDRGVCNHRRCMTPSICPLLKPDHGPQLALLRQIRRIAGVKKVFIASGIRYDLLLHDRDCGGEYLREIVEQHVSGQMKVAPEHSEARILELMGKPKSDVLLQFKGDFDRLNRVAGKKQFLTYYLIAAHPGCGEQDMRKLKKFASKKLKILPEQVQIFTPTPSTYSSLMYYTEMDPFTRQPIFVEKEHRGKVRQKNIVVPKNKG